MENAHAVSTPMDLGAAPLMVPYLEQAAKADIEEYQSLIGSLMYLCTQTRLDLAYPMSVLSRFLQNPSPAHMNAGRRALRYTKGTDTVGVTYREKVIPFALHGYSDSDHGGDHEFRLSTSGWVFFYGGGPISWSAKRQTHLALSSTEAEYYGLSNAAREAAWLRLMFSSLGYGGKDTHKIRLIGDNQAALALAENPEFHQRTKHIEIQWHYIRDQVAKGLVDLHFVATEDMAADGLTKALNKAKHTRFIELVNLHPLKL